MKKFFISMFFIHFLLAECGVFTNVLQTRKDPSAINVKSGAIGYIYDSPGCVLNTGSVYNDGKHGLKCGDGFASASGIYGKSLNIDYDFTLILPDVDDKPGGGSSHTVKNNNEILTENKYKTIYQDWHHYSFTWSPEGYDIGVDKFNSIINTVTIDNIENKDLKIGQFITYSSKTTQLNLTEIPNKVEIYKLQSTGSNIFSISTAGNEGLEAKKSIEIDTLVLKSSKDTNIILKAPKVIIRKMDLTNKNNHITIYADEIDIDEIDFGEQNTLTIHPYTPGNKVKFYNRQTNLSSSSQMIWDSGDYYIKDIDIPGSGKGISFVNASGPEEIINWYIDSQSQNHDFEIGNNFGINSEGTDGKFGNNPPANFRIYVNGDLSTGGGGTTFNALIYVEGETDLGSPTYVKGAISSYETITIGNKSEFYWDKSIESLPEAEACIPPKASYDNNYVCGIFKGPLISYDTIQGNGTNPKICGSLNLYAAKVNNDNLTCSIYENCSNLKECNVKTPPINRYNPKFVDSGKVNDIPNDLNFTNRDYKNYNFENNNLVLNFDPQESYSDNPTKYSTFGDWTFKGNNITLNFKPGDYYFDKLTFNGNDIYINVLDNGPVRIFVKENLRFDKTNIHINDGGDENNLFIYVGGDLEFTDNSGDNGPKIYAFVYVKGNVEFKPNSNDFYWYGGVTAEGDITIDSDNAHFIYRGINNKLGYGDCTLCYAYTSGNNFLSFDYVMGSGEIRFPLTTAIINQLYPVNELNVTQNEDLSNLNEEFSCYSVVDNNGNVIDRDIEILISQNSDNIFVPATNLLNEAMSTTSQITETFTGRKCIGSVNADVKVIADFGDYSNSGFNYYWALRTYMENVDIGNPSIFSYEATYKKDGKKYKVNLGYCNIPNGHYTGNRGPFDAWDTFRNMDNITFKDRNISTKIVNKDFDLILASLNAQDNRLEVKNVGDINVSIYDMSSGNRISNIVYFNTNTTPITRKSFKVISASKDARVGFLICSIYNSTLKTHTLFDYSKCSGEIYNCNHADVQTPSFKLCFSSDNFAIRPKEFNISNIPANIKAGEEFNLTFKAIDENGNSSNDYNETINFNASPKIEYNISKNGCEKGTLSLINGNDFKNGETNTTFSYNEVGEVNITIKEVKGSEFAKVDEDDTPDNERLIPSSHTLITIIPHHFDVVATFDNFNNSDFTYISNNLKMSSTLNLIIKAQNKQNQITKNYNNSCYAKNCDINISYTNNLPSTIKKILVKENNNEINFTIPNNIYLTFNKDIFINQGEANLGININLEKNYTTPVKEFNFTIKEINFTDEDNVKGNINLDKNVTFRYGRIDVKNVSGYTNELNTTFKYEYWSDEGWIVNKNHTSIFGDINLTKSIYPSDINITKYPIDKGEEKIKIATTHALPYSAKIHLSIPSWLWYHPLAKNYKDPSSNNLDCLTHPCVSVSFEKVSKGWAGVGKNNTKYSETNRTSKTNSSTIQVDKKSFQKINW